MKSSKEYRAAAKAALKNNWGMAILTMLIFGLINSALAAAAGIGIILLGGAMSVGLAIAFTNLFRKGSMELGDMFDGFKCNFVSTIGLFVKTLVFEFLWSLLLIVPGIIASYAYAMAPYILSDNPNIKGGAAIKASKKLMKGKKWKLFCLEFSYIGWLLLSILTFGILLLWVEPWMEAAKADFYESIKHEVVIEG